MVLEKEWEELFLTLSKIHQGFALGFAEAGDEDLCCVSVIGKTSVSVDTHSRIKITIFTGSSVSENNAHFDCIAREETDFLIF